MPVAPPRHGFLAVEALIMADRYDNDGDWRRDPWWQHDQNPAQGFSGWRGDASDPEWHERQHTRGGPRGSGRIEPYSGRPRGRDYPREDYDRDYGQDFGGGRAYGYDRHDVGDYRARRPDYGPDYARPYSARDWRGFGGRDYVRGPDDFIRYDAFARDWDYAGYGAGRGYADSYRRGRYAGRGPRGYRRSDERIREDINDLLTADPHIDASDIEVRVTSGVVALSGIVEDRAAKRYAEDLAEDVLGVDDVNNQLKVRHGFLSGLTGEKAGERELSRAPSREATTSSTRKARTSV
jgi:hypothetical protein